MKKQFSIALLFFLATLSVAYSQKDFTRKDNITVLSISGDTLKNPWAGGFNSVQFSEIDLDLDGTMDLFVFDRSGNRISTFINAGTPNKVTYKHAPEYAKMFPDLADWVLLRDYNCDGKMDIFTTFPGGMTVHKNTSTASLSFAPNIGLLKSDLNPNGPNPNKLNIYNARSNLPAIDDIDGDGDLDILVIDQFGFSINYHKNLTMERNSTCDSLDFQLRNKCWGFLKIGKATSSFTLFDTCSFNINSPEDITPIPHLDEGISLLTLDVDANGTKDLVVSNYNKKNLNLLINNDQTPTRVASSLITRDSIFPQNNQTTSALKLDIFPAGFYLDVNNDNVKDLISAPNYPFGCEDLDNVWHYTNTGTDNNPVFEYVENAFIQDGMIEVGEGAHPVFFDYNADGLMDIIIGNHGVYDTSKTSPVLYNASLWLYENIGTATTPAFQLVNKDYAGLQALKLNVDSNRITLGLKPTFGDLDGDNDLDMIVGDYNGYLHYFENSAGPSNPAVFTLSQAKYQNIYVKSNAAPLLYDLNKDNLLDLVIGNIDGTFHFYKNIGSSALANFSFVTDSLGKVATTRQYQYQGNSCPVIIDSSGTTILYSGAKDGYIYKYTNLDGNLTGTFNADSAYHNIWEGANSYISLHDVSNDGLLDLLVGNLSGGVAYFAGDSLTVGIKKPLKQLNNIKIYPNPTSKKITIDFGSNSLTNASIQLMSITGKTLLDTKVNSTKTSLPMGAYAKGIYLLRLSNTSGNATFKIVRE